MIIGSGLVASGLHDMPGVVQYAAGVSNPRGRRRICPRQTAACVAPVGAWAVRLLLDLHPTESAYVDHKRACEQMVVDRGDYLICRLPIVAGKTWNPIRC